MADSHSASASHQHADPLMAYYAVFATLVILLGATVGAYYISFEKMFGEDWGWLNTALALVIATVKASLVVLIFMHLRHGTKLTWVVAAAGFLGLGLMITFSFADYMSRSSIPEAHYGSDPASIKLVTPQATHSKSAPFDGMG